MTARKRYTVLGKSAPNAKAHIELRRPTMAVEIDDMDGVPMHVRLCLDVEKMVINDHINGVFTSLTKAEARDLARRLDRALTRFEDMEKKEAERINDLRYK